MSSAHPALVDKMKKKKDKKYKKHKNVMVLNSVFMG